jgi:DEAD/DEAH box helicase domain-containing protein
MAALIGRPVDVVDQDTSPSGTRHYVLWNPEVGEDDIRRSALADATDVFVDLVRRGEHTIAFAGRESSWCIAGRERLGPISPHGSPIPPGYLAEAPPWNRHSPRAICSG